MRQYLRGGIHGYILLTIDSMRTSTVALLIDSFYREQSINEWTIMPKRRDSLIRLEIIVSVIIFTETCVHVVENRSSVFIEI